MQLTFLEYGILLAFLIAIFSLLILIRKTFKFGRKKLRSEPQGRELNGIIYAFGQGMLPWEKESAAKHLPTYIGGIFYHAGLFTTFFYVFLRLFRVPVSDTILIIFQIILGLGFIFGIGLFIKRISVSSLRKISCPDDFCANILVDGFILLALLEMLLGGIWPVLNIITIVVLLYVPAGKIRHCFFFFYSRILFGMFFGRRKVLGHKHTEGIA